MDVPRKKPKKPSAVNNAPPESPPIFLDRSLDGEKLTEALRAHGVVVHRHRDFFVHDTRDEDWLTTVGEKGWVVLTKDKRIRYRSIEREALINARVRAFVLVAGNLSGNDIAETFTRALPKILAFIGEHEPPFIARILKNGEIKPDGVAYEKDTSDVE